MATNVTTTVKRLAPWLAAAAIGGAIAPGADRQRRRQSACAVWH